MMNLTLHMLFVWLSCEAMELTPSAKIDQSRSAALSISGISDLNEASELLAQTLPRFGHLKDDVAAKSLYVEQFGSFKNDFKTLSSNGQDAVVYSVHLAADRPNARIPSGRAIALRVAKNGDKYDRDSAAITIKKFAQVQELNAKYIKFYPEFYGAYLAKADIKYQRYVPAMCQEMELMDGTIASHFNVGNDYNWRRPSPKIPDHFIFEWCLGEWASAYFAGVGSSDNKMENFGVLNEPTARRYIIEGHEFVLPPGLMPKRLDLGGTGVFSGTRQSLNSSFMCSASRASNGELSAESKQFLNSLSLRNKGTTIEKFAAFYDQFKGNIALDGGVQETRYEWPELKFD